MKTRELTETVPAANSAVPQRRACRTAPVLCERCGCGMLLLEEAVAVAGVTSRVIHQWVEAGAVHFAETPDGLLLICLNSLAASHEGIAELPAEQQAALPRGD